MSKKDKELEAMYMNVANEANVTPMCSVEPAEDDGVVYATIVKREDGYHVIDKDGTEGPVCKLVDEGDRTIALTKNASNRKWFNRKKADEAIEANGSCPLYYKASKTFGPRGTSVGTRNPLAKLVPYMTEEDKKEYEAIMARAIEKMEADIKKPKTELEKAQEALEKAQAKLAALVKAQSGEETVEEQVQE